MVSEVIDNNFKILKTEYTAHFEVITTPNTFN
jgi:hypothetical protein